MRRVSATSIGDRAAALAAAVDVLRRGGIVAYPTDTFYGLAADPANDAAMARLFEVKRRDRTLPVPLIAADVEQACAAGQFGSDELRIARSFWPGPLTVVVPARTALLRLSAAHDGTVAIRVPAHLLARALASAFGGCITATSANVSGHPPTAAPDDVAASLGDRIDFLLDGGAAPGGAPSTIVSVRDGAFTLIRAGAIASDRVLESLK